MCGFFFNILDVTVLVPIHLNFLIELHTQYCSDGAGLRRPAGVAEGVPGPDQAIIGPSRNVAGVCEEEAISQSHFLSNPESTAQDTVP